VRMLQAGYSRTSGRMRISNEIHYTMKTFQVLAALSVATVTLLSGCIHVEDEGEERTTRTTTTTSGGLLTPSTTTVQRTTVEHD